MALHKQNEIFFVVVLAASRLMADQCYLEDAVWQFLGCSFQNANKQRTLCKPVSNRGTE
jgi:hypothetical protein